MDATSTAKPKFSRTGTPRSKGACSTCRDRRVKCDEARPECIRCLKTDRICGGYILPIPTIRKKNKNSLPNSFRNIKTLLPLQAVPSPLRSMNPSPIFLGESEMENRYFRHFQQVAQTGQDGVWGWYLWNRLMMQNSHHESFIWHSVIAIGALLKSQETALLEGVHPQAVNVPKVAKLHRQFAMVKYGKAIKLIQKVIRVKDTNPRQALLGCILIVCFEMHIGNRHLALKHAQSGSSILQQWRVKNLAPERCHSQPLSPVPSVIEDEIVEAFQALDIQITTLGDERYHRSTIQKQSTIIGDCAPMAVLPTSFTDLREARVYLTLIVRRVFHFGRMVWSPFESMGLGEKLDPEPPISVLTGINFYRIFNEIPDNILTQNKQLQTELSNWLRIFEKRQDHVHINSDYDEPGVGCMLKATSMMRMQYLATTVSLTGIVLENEIEYDRFDTQFQEIVDLATTVVESRQRSRAGNTWVGGLWADVGVTPQLFTVAMRCRHPIIRRKAIKLLEQGYMEGGWDPRLFAQLGSLTMEMEEERAKDLGWEGEEKGAIPESARVVFSRICENSQKEWAIVQCAMKSEEVDGGLVWRERRIEL